MEHITGLPVIVGLGKTGLSLVEYFTQMAQSCVVWDTRPAPAQLSDFQKRFPDVLVICGPLQRGALNTASHIIASPGVPLSEPAIQAAIESGVPVSSDINLFAAQAGCQLVGITGSNGKSTATTLVGQMAQNAARRSWVAGNIGIPVMALWRSHQPFQPEDLVILELSSFQLERGEPIPLKVGAILNLSPDHLDRYPDFESYVSAKHAVYQACEVVVFNRHDPLTIPSGTCKSQFITFGLDAPQAKSDVGIIMLPKTGERYLAIGQEALMPVNELKIVGEHNVMNALSALAIGASIGLPIDAMRQTLREFTGLPHRCQLVHAANGVSWINDSKATNPGSCLASIEGLGPSVSGKIVLIAGGDTKGASFHQLQGVIEKYVSHLVLLGKDTSELFSLFNGIVPCTPVTNMADAVAKSAIFAKSGDIVLLAPACASFDLFKHFEERGEQFIHYVKQHVGQIA